MTAVAQARYSDRGVGLPEQVRYRCNACGNLTRFDVIEERRTRSFYHYTLGGELAVEHTEDLEHRVEQVICRWCQTGTSVSSVASDEQLQASEDRHIGSGDEAT